MHDETAAPGTRLPICDVSVELRWRGRSVRRPAGRGERRIGFASVSLLPIASYFIPSERA